MPAGRVSMRHVREILRLGFAGISKHEIARRTGLAPSTVRETLKRFAATGLAWPLPDDVTDGALEALLYKNAGKKQGHRRHAEPDWAGVHRELKRKHVTLSILWDEYIEQHPTDIAIPASAISTGPGKASSRSRCARPMPAARNCSSITPATGRRW